MNLRDFGPELARFDEVLGRLDWVTTQPLRMQDAPAYAAFLADAQRAVSDLEQWASTGIAWLTPASGGGTLGGLGSSGPLISLLASGVVSNIAADALLRAFEAIRGSAGAARKRLGTSPSNPQEFQALMDQLGQLSQHVRDELDAAKRETDAMRS